ncbi:hemolysin A [Clostridium homopropionicum DSM 5847]|uniref:Hemolysin A n=1 Tax=Clostridium homopropionicum DSM 5847 TaxID=1121318 RepID=A0A0L6ZD74_9CLOT|nr:TlyA family RNA methyltransferase [Clostridium homopropionicum]KOA20934.1 hemolysin A [Clostridium homopropionicum DSM 5847]SFG01861.1 23S rRNA (cytidine1920-2'-O)/16S rRNA (cytidine1409-2'-O)-methyltransferase [Clostridium homopropionicum]
MKESKSSRLDLLLVQKGIFESREKAQSSIMAGEIFIDGQRVDKCGQKVKENANIEFKGQQMPYVSRGGFKLERAINTFKIDLEGKICMDIGASTGGFTDCMLQNGAKQVFSIDVGYGQFAWKLRTDPRVVCMERTNARYITNEDIGVFTDFASIDVSFISLTKIIPPILNLMTENAEVVALIKPQFEAGREKVGKRGVVREAAIHEEVIENIIEFLINNNLKVLGLDYSPIRGPEGNIEYLVYFTKNPNSEIIFDKNIIKAVVEQSHNTL